MTSFLGRSGAGGQEFPPIPPERFRRGLISNNPRGQTAAFQLCPLPFLFGNLGKDQARESKVSAKMAGIWGVLPFRKSPRDCVYRIHYELGARIKSKCLSVLWGIAGLGMRLPRDLGGLGGKKINKNGVLKVKYGYGVNK